MKKRISEKSFKPSRRSASSTKLLPLQSTASDSLKAPKKKLPKKNRNFGDDITNGQKQPVSQSMQIEHSSPPVKEGASKISEIEPYLWEIGQYVRKLDESFNEQVSNKLRVRSSDSTQITLDMRKILVRWILQVAEKFKVNMESVHICVQIVDYVLVFSEKFITKANFQLLGITALFVASKYNEIYTLEAKKFVYVCDGLYELSDLFKMESYILSLTNFNLQFPTIHNFMGPIENDPTLCLSLKETVKQISRLVVMDFSLSNKYKKTTLTGVIIYLAAKVTQSDKFNTKMMMEQMSISQRTFGECLTELIGVYRQYAKSGEQQLTRKG